MSTLSYLKSRAGSAVLSNAETTSITTSITTLGSRLGYHFTRAGDGLSNHFRFGSSTRGTILPRYLDGRSDIDYMVVFEQGGFAPQTYLARLKRFAQERYGTSELYQSNPTVVLELNHIKFDLVPALHQWGTYYKIPSADGQWQDTNPNDFNATLEAANVRSSYLLKPTIRLMKIWNAANGYVYDSFGLEKWMAGLAFWGVSNERDYLFSVFDNLHASTSTQWRNDKINRAKAIVEQTRSFDRRDMGYFAEQEVKKLIPE